MLCRRFVLDAVLEMFLNHCMPVDSRRVQLHRKASSQAWSVGFAVQAKLTHLFGAGVPNPSVGISTGLSITLQDECG
jgi:hypothetical protein